MANEHALVTVLFCDVCGFTEMSKQISPAAVAGFLNELYGERARPRVCLDGVP